MNYINMDPWPKSHYKNSVTFSHNYSRNKVMAKQILLWQGNKICMEFSKKGWKIVSRDNITGVNINDTKIKDLQVTATVFNKYFLK